MGTDGLSAFVSCIKEERIFVSLPSLVAADPGFSHTEVPDGGLIEAEQSLIFTLQMEWVVTIFGSQLLPCNARKERRKRKIPNSLETTGSGYDWVNC